MVAAIKNMFEALGRLRNTVQAIRASKPGKLGEGVIDEATFKTIEVDKLFEAINHSSTFIGHATLYHSLTQPLNNSSDVKLRHEALRELATNPELKKQLSELVKNAAVDEETFYILLFGTFVGFFGTAREKYDIDGYGYRTYIKGTKFLLDVVKNAQALPNIQSTYLNQLIDAIKRFRESSAYALMQGPVYLTERGIKLQHEKSKYTPAMRFRPSFFKPGILFGAIAFFLAASYFAPYAASMVSVSALPVALVFLFPFFIFFIPAIGSFDRDSFIYPLRDRYLKSEEVKNCIAALGQIDELLSFSEYEAQLKSNTCLPEVIESNHHSLMLKQVKNPILVKTNFHYVANDIDMDGVRLTLITGPNSGGKTAFCKTIAQSQLLAQIGCYLPAISAQISICDRIFYQAPEMSSLSDEEGRFGTELKHTKDIFLSVTPHSLVILDEMAEGTTFEEKLDISYNVLYGFYRIGNNTILITHNHALVDRFKQQAIGQYRQVEFIDENPTHKIIDGISRVSHADRVAKNIGFAKQHIEEYLKEKGYIS